MSKIKVHNVNVARQEVLVTPERLKQSLPPTDSQRAMVAGNRQAIWDVLDRKDHRLIVVVGPCSIHDPVAAMDYAQRLRTLADELSDTLLLVMRVYFEKPRTTVGWKGLINDPYMDDSFKIEDGLRIGRKLLGDVVDLGLPASTEALDPISPQYMQDLISWAAIGARTAESQTHREMASGLSSAVGFKNGTDGNLAVATNAIKSAARPHRFLGINSRGEVAVFTTRGNRYGHIVLRGGAAGPNYDSVHVSLCEDALADAGVVSNIMVDCSHANSSKRPELQPLVVENVVNQMVEGNRSIIGLMLESNIEAGSQPIAHPPAQMKYGVSVTDGCIGWDETAACLRSARKKLKRVLLERQASNIAELRAAAGDQ